jgi:hypothetical protein
MSSSYPICLIVFDFMILIMQCLYIIRNVYRYYLVVKALFMDVGRPHMCIDARTISSESLLWGAGTQHTRSGPLVQSIRWRQCYTVNAEKTVTLSRAVDTMSV